MPQSHEMSNTRPTDDGSPARLDHSLVQAIRAVPSLAALDDAELLALAGESANLVWPAGSVVVARGSATDGLYIVLTGLARVLDAAGKELSVLGPGEVFGEFSLLLGTPRQHDVVAAEDTELMVVPKERIQALLDSRPEFARNVRAQLEARQAANVRREQAAS
jgi:potassium-dependent mechanosensitive channel